MTSYTIARVFDASTHEWTIVFSVFRYYAGGLSKAKRFFEPTLGM